LGPAGFGAAALAAAGLAAGLAAAGFAAAGLAAAGFAAAGFAVVVAVRAAAARALRTPEVWFATVVTAAARAAVAAFAVAALAVAAFAVAAFAVAALTVAALAVAALTVAALAREARVPVAALVPVARLAREAGAGRSVVVWVVPDRCAVPWRCVGTLLVAFSSDEPTVRRLVPRAEGRGDAVPVTGSDPSMRRRSWWSELMHLTSVGGHCRGAPGERSGAHVNTSLSVRDLKKGVDPLGLVT
jgi:hypothetical protein